MSIDTQAATPLTIADLESGCRALAQARGDLAEQLREFNRAIEQLRKEHGPALIAALRLHNTTRDVLEADIARVPATCFAKPRTVQFHGIKVGLQKGSDKLQLQLPEADTLALIRKHWPDQEQALIRKSEWPNREALEEFTTEDLAKIGGIRVEGKDAIVCRPVDGDVEKLIKTLAKAGSGLVEGKGEGE